MKAVWATVVAALAALAVLPGCALKEDFKSEVQGYLRHTETVARSYVYTENAGGKQARLNVNVADDLTFSVDYQLNGRPQMSEVVVDDSRALQVSDHALLDGITAAEPAPAATPSPSAQPASTSTQPAALSQGADVLTALRSGQWVVDPSGAHSLLRLRPKGRQPQIGDDRVADALDVLNYMDQSLVNVDSRQVLKFNPESGGYFRDLDPFPWPAPGVTRYDINENPYLPGRSSVQSAGNQARQQLELLRDYFREAAVYVRGGLVVSVRESIDVKRRLQLPDQDLLQRLQDGGIRVPASVMSGSLATQAAFIVAELNTYYASQGIDPLRERQLDVAFSFNNRPLVTLPPATARGSLAQVFNRGQILGGAGT